jgi:N-formylglutamate amidohydrolase
MDTVPPDDPFGDVLEIEAPATRRVPMVVASPHSGQNYPPAFLAQSALDPRALRRSEDSYVDELFAAGPRLGAPLLKALFPRAYLDVNREAYELDPLMFDGPLPAYVNIDSPRVAAGLGTIARVVANGAEIYRRRLSFAEAERRIDQLYRPYHAALTRLVAETRQAFGHCLLVDGHSMPSIGGPVDSDRGSSRVDMVLGDCFGSSCAPVVTQTAETTLRRLGYRVLRNAPYAGGYTTRHYGNPGQGVHAVQIEINRALYMNEATHVRLGGFAKLQADLGAVLAALVAIPAEELC